MPLYIYILGLFSQRSQKMFCVFVVEGENSEIACGETIRPMTPGKRSFEFNVKSNRNIPVCR
jgi:hypothetical protein